jgi:hypothetical protein
MRRFRFHIGTRLLIVLFTGVGFAALGEPSNLGDRSILSTISPRTPLARR